MKMNKELNQEERIKHIEEMIDFYLRDIYDFCKRKGFSRTGTHYWHIVANGVMRIQGGLVRFKKTRSLEDLSSTEKNIQVLETYFNLLEQFPDYLKGESQINGVKGNFAFPDFRGNDIEYIYESKQRLES